MLVSHKFQPHSEQRSQKLINLLRSAAANEMLTHRLYVDFLDNSKHLSTDISELCETALTEDQSHLKTLMQSIERLSGNHCNNDLKLVHLPADYQPTTDCLLSKLCVTEAVSVQMYNEICNIAIEYDYQVFDLSYRNMNENLAHLDFVSHLLSNLKSTQPVNKELL